MESCTRFSVSLLGFCGGVGLGLTGGDVGMGVACGLLVGAGVTPGLLVGAGVTPGLLVGAGVGLFVGEGVAPVVPPLAQVVSLEPHSSTSCAA
mmetsp:Transcript_9024/g.28721  ORF Transcript_9024/g.28721 Transcript_9024/m.28721 type:complete len:93 (-) Transcript_9024:394-672(-)